MSLKVFNVSLVILSVIFFAGNSKECSAGSWRDIQESETWDQVKGRVSTRIAICQMKVVETGADIDKHRLELWKLRLEVIGKTMVAYQKPSAEAFGLIDTTGNVQIAKLRVMAEKVRGKETEVGQEDPVTPVTVYKARSTRPLLTQSNPDDGGDEDERSRREQEFWDDYDEELATQLAEEMSIVDQGGPGTRPKVLPLPNFPWKAESE